MRGPILLCVAAIAFSCAPADERAAQEQAADAATVSLADLAGT
jgi:hypothetical protein